MFEYVEVGIISCSESELLALDVAKVWVQERREDGEHVEHVSGVDTKLHHSQSAKAIDGSMRL